MIKAPKNFSARLIFSLHVVFCLTFLVSFRSLAFSQTIDFQRDVRPILSDKCFACHGPDQSTREADLRLDVESAAKEDLGGYFAIDLDDPDESEVLNRILSHDDDVMPPEETGKPLTRKEIATLKTWIEQGAPWAKHWAYEKAPPTKPKKLVSVTFKDWAINDIDRYLLAGMESAELQPVQMASKTTLIRRLYFDLTGLPPTPSQVNAFLNDDSPNAYQKQVQHLLRPPHYGERIATFWLDLVRYANTVGYHGDQDHNIAPYRDWVIDAFNRDMPFDQFTREQLAGDLLKNPSQSQLIATGYNRLLQTTHEGGLQPKEYRAIYAADRVRNVSAVWMGATVGCAQCHDHKYDPYTAKDFYAMSAFFADIDDEQHFKSGTNALPTRRPPELELPTNEQAAKIEQLQSMIKENKLPKKELEQKKRELKQVRNSVRRTMITVALKQPRTVRILPRGDWLDDSGDVVQPAIPEFMGMLKSSSRLTRLDLANWLVGKGDSSARFETSRVLVNRVWAMLMGRGISADLADFGGQGVPPTHPELLDHLAYYFIANGMSVKKLVGYIVTSKSYRLSSKPSTQQTRLDPENKFFSRQARYRLPAEMIRDQALLVSGLLNDQIGGGVAKPYQPAGYYRHLNFPPRKYRQSNDRHQWRRGVYVHWQRQFVHPTFRALDAPTREECTAQRPRSNTPLAALSLLNDPTFVEAARHFAQRTITQGGKSDADKIKFAFRWATLRTPSTVESQILNELLAKERARYRSDEAAAKKLATVGLSKPDESVDVVELAAWTSVCRALFNISETITRD